MTKKNKKVTIFHCGFIYSGGGERIVLEEARGLRSRGYDVEVYAPTVDYKNCYPEMLKELEVKAILPTVIDKLPYRNALRMVVSSILAPILAIKFRKTDVFIGANQPGVWIAYCMARVLGKPFVIYLNQPNRVVHPRPVDMEYGWYTTVKDFQLLYRALRIVGPVIEFLDNRSIKAADHVLANGGFIGSIIENVYSREVVDAPAGAYAYKVGKPDDKKPYALITNRHDPQKRFDYVITAFSEVVKNVPKARLIIPGPFTDHTKKLVNLAKKFNIDHKITFTGKITEKELQKLYEHATVYCYPSPQEDFGLGPLEAGGWGVPTVAWNHGGPTVTVENGVTGFLAEPYDTSDYAKYMVKLFKNKSLRKRMGQAAFERTKKKFSWEAHNDILEKAMLSPRSF
jgi:glycosyltransferase involved in cell wall biosynthesis